MQRRSFLSTAAWGGAAGATPGPVGASSALSELPNFCGHEHWGSIDPIGRLPQGFRADVQPGAIPARPASFMDLVLEPYFQWWLRGGGTDLAGFMVRGKPVLEVARESGWDAFQALRPVFETHRYTGVYQCTRRGILQLYRIDIDKLDRQSTEELDAAVGARYARLFEWYQTAMRQARFSGLIRIVHPEFYGGDANSPAAVQESSFTHTILRIDPFLDLYAAENPRRKALAAIVGIEPGDGPTWRAFLRAWFARAAAHGARGIKQLQAYDRSLEFLPRSDGEVRWKGALTPAEVRVFQDWVMHECCKLADDYGWPHQIHVGTDNLPQSSPLPLGALAERYRKMRIVMLHCWPFVRESGNLAKFHPNVYLDTCWQPVLSPGIFREAITAWWNYLPYHKITCSNDSTTVEMACGSALFVREILAEILGDGRVNMGAGESDIRRAALALLHDNAVSLYGAGELVTRSAAQPPDRRGRRGGPAQNRPAPR